MKTAWPIAAAFLVIAAVPAFAFPVYTEDFEIIPLGSLDGQTGSGGVSWATTTVAGSAEAFAALPGHTGEKSGRWDVRDVGMVSEGDDMVATFTPVGPQIVVTAWTYSFLSYDPLYTGTRFASFDVIDGLLTGVGVGLVWRADGLLGSTYGDVSNISFVNQQWKQVKIEVNYATEAWALYYDNMLIASGASLLGNGVAASNLNIYLETKDLDANPNPNDSFLVDDIIVTPEPAGFLLLTAAALLRRR